jgi:hypothetical protein
MRRRLIFAATGAGARAAKDEDLFFVALTSVADLVARRSRCKP